MNWACKCLNIMNIWLSNKVSFVLANRKPIILSFVWISFLLFFTYTTLLVEAIKIDGNFYSFFYNDQSQYVALFVNIGIIIMLLFDNHAANKEFHGVEYYIPIIAITLCIVLMAHCDCNINNELHKFITPLSYEKLSIILYCCFIIMIYYLKARSLCETTVQKKGVN